MIKKLNITKDHLKLIPFLYVKESDDGNSVNIDKSNIFCLGSHLLEDMATILGMEDKEIPKTKNDPDGRAYESDAEKYMLDLYNDIKDNLYYYETLIHQFSVKGGLKEGTYKALDNELIWEKEN